MKIIKLKLNEMKMKKNMNKEKKIVKNYLAQLFLYLINNITFFLTWFVSSASNYQKFLEAL